VHQTLTARPREELTARAERLDALLETFPHRRSEALWRADELTRLRDQQRDAHERIGEQLARLDQLGPLARIFGRSEREFTERMLRNWTQHAAILDERV